MEIVKSNRGGDKVSLDGNMYVKKNLQELNKVAVPTPEIGRRQRSTYY